MKTLKLEHDEISLLKQIVGKYSKEVKDEYYRLVNTSITEEQRKLHTQEREVIDRLITKLEKK